MFDWVPEPVCQTTSGKWSSQLAGGDLGRRRRDRLAELRVEVALSMFTSAAACLITPSARTIATGCFSQPIGKFMIDRWVCAPQ